MLDPKGIKSIVDVVSSLIDARAKTTEALFKAEIRSSEQRTKEEMDILNLDSGLVKKGNKHGRRIENLEEKTKTDDPTKH